jgi:hypothetical protein
VEGREELITQFQLLDDPTEGRRESRREMEGEVYVVARGEKGGRTRRALRDQEQPTPYSSETLVASLTKMVLASPISDGLHGAFNPHRNPPSIQIKYA